MSNTKHLYHAALKILKFFQTINYVSLKKANMTEELFTGWLRDLDRLMQYKKQNMVLIVDNCTAHLAIDGLTNVKLELLPPNITCLIQTIDEGIIAAFKYYLYLYFSYLVWKKGWNFSLHFSYKCSNIKLICLITLQQSEMWFHHWNLCHI